MTANRLEIVFSNNWSSAGSEMIACGFAFEDEVIAGAAGALDARSDGALGRAVELHRFRGRAGETLEAISPAASDLARVMLVGLGVRASADGLILERAAASAFAVVCASGAETLEVWATDLMPEQAARVAFGMLLSAYRFEGHLSRPKPKSTVTVRALRIVCDDPERTEAAFAAWSSLADGIYLARDLVSEPGNVLYPAAFAARLEGLRPLGLEVEVLGEAAMSELGMGALLGVGLGSSRESQIAVLRWNGGVAGEAPLAFVGKGVCFDTGGISLKTGGGMESMIWDMAGAGAVAGALLSLARRRAPVNAVGVLALVENMPDGAAIRPGDILTSMSGQTIEIISTDAEGRLVLADALWYCQTRFEPRVIIDLATLTGASRVALGSEYAALFANNEDLAAELSAAGEATGDRVWRLPLSTFHESTIETPRADMKNYHDNSGGAITGALFLQRFLKDSATAWAHIDMTPTAWWSPSPLSTVPIGATGFGVRLLDEFARQSEPGRTVG